MMGESVRQSIITYSAASSVCEMCEQWHNVLGTCEILQRESARRCLISYNTAMNACEKGKRWPQALELVIRKTAAKDCGEIQLPSKLHSVRARKAGSGSRLRNVPEVPEECDENACSKTP